jgi:hypothetical protein
VVDIMCVANESDGVEMFRVVNSDRLKGSDGKHEAIREIQVLR